MAALLWPTASRGAISGVRPHHQSQGLASMAQQAVQSDDNLQWGKRPLGCTQGVPLTQKARVPVLFQIASQNGQDPTPSHIAGSALFGQMWAWQCQAGLSKACLCQMMFWSYWLLTGCEWLCTEPQCLPLVRAGAARGPSASRPDSTAFPPQYGIVLDAGSSHTAMFIYKWPADKENDTGVVSEHSTCDVEGKVWPWPRAGGWWRCLLHVCGRAAWSECPFYAQLPPSIFTGVVMCSKRFSSIPKMSPNSPQGLQQCMLVVYLFLAGTEPPGNNPAPCLAQ